MILNLLSAVLVTDTAEKASGAFSRTVQGIYESVVERLPFLIAGILVVALFWLVGRIIKRFFEAAYRKSLIDVQVRILMGRLISTIALILGILSALTVVIPSLTIGEVIAGLGFTSFIIGFATKDILNNMLSGLIILWRQPFGLGDYLYVKDREGVVEFIGMRATALRTANGEVALIPNADIYSSPITIRKAGSKLRLAIDIAVDSSFDSNSIRQIFLEAADRIDGVLSDPPPSVLISSLGSEGLRFSLGLWTDTSKTDVDALQDEILKRVNEQFVREGIKIFPVTEPAK
jgi:small conductance mechanosensitive channel